MPAFGIGLTTGLFLGYGIATLLSWRYLLAHMNETNDRLERVIAILRVLDKED
jgi:hypothetical protein